MTKRTLSQHAHAAKIIRKNIKDMGLVAKVRAKSATMTSSVDVTLMNPTPEQLKEVKDMVSKFQYGSFNGYEDIYEYNNGNADLPQVKYTFVSCEFDDELKQKALNALCDVARIEPMKLEEKPMQLDVGFPYATYTDELIHKVLCGNFDRIDFWGYYDQKVA